MTEFIEKLIGRLEEYEDSHLIEHDSERLKHCKEVGHKACDGADCFLCVWDKAKEIVNEFSKEYNNDFCEWKKYEDKHICYNNCKWRNEDIDEYTVSQFKFCPYCGKKIKVVSKHERILQQ